MKAILSNQDVFIPNNSLDNAMVNGEISPILGNYVEITATTIQLAYAYVSY